MTDSYNDPLAQREAERAASEAGGLGGNVSSDPAPASGAPDEAQRPLAEAGEGEAEGFELAEQALEERASYGDQHAARQAIEDAPRGSDDALAAGSGEADREYSSERDDDR